MPDFHAGFFVLTGGPGAGKTTVIDALSQRGFATTVEAGRGVIAAQQELDGPALPWIDPETFAEAMLAWDIQSYEAALEADSPVFFDRGTPDIVGYRSLTGLPIPLHLQQATDFYRYDRRVFVFPPWQNIYRQDTERQQTFRQAEQTHAWMVRVYRGLGYDLIEVPRTHVEARVDFILSHTAA